MAILKPTLGFANLRARFSLKKAGAEARIRTAKGTAARPISRRFRGLR